MQIMRFSPRLKSPFEKILESEIFFHFQITNRVEYQRFDEKNTTRQQRSNKFVNRRDLMFFQNYILFFTRFLRGFSSYGTA